MIEIGPDERAFLEQRAARDKNICHRLELRLRLLFLTQCLFLALNAVASGQRPEAPNGSIAVRFPSSLQLVRSRGEEPRAAPYVASSAETREIEELRAWYDSVMAGPPSDAESRKAARARAEVRIFRQGEQEAEADADALLWDRIPVDERAEFVWQLSLELHALANPEARHEPGLSRSVARVIRR